MIKAIIFDVDGVLSVDKPILHARHDAMYYAISKKYKISFSDAKKKYSNSKLNLPEYKKHTSVYKLGSLGFSREEFFDIINDVDQSKAVFPNENLLSTLRKLKDKFILVAYSNTPEIATLKTLNQLRIRDSFTKVFCADHFDESKPSKRNLLKILKEVKLKKEEVIILGNSLEKDILPARQLGIKAILFDDVGKYKNPEPPVIYDLIEIFNYL